MTEFDTVVYNADEVVVGPEQSDTESVYGVTDRFGPDADLVVHEDAAVAVVDGRVASVGPTEDVTADYPPENAATAVDADGQAVLPGFVDSHTHMVFAGDRSDEFAARLGGADYQKILSEGGGILRTVRAVRAASDEQLVEGLLSRLDTALAYGATTVEVKSGYGLDRETELRLLSAIDEANERHPVDVVATFMGAHAVPAETTADEYVERVIDEQLPAVAEQGVATFCDVFCEEDVFTVEQSRRVLEEGRDHGLAAKIHADEFTRLGGTALGADLGTVSADHLLHASAADVTALREAGVVPTYLPAAAFSLREPYADPEPAQETGAPIALATDFNPNCHSRSVPMTVALACCGMGLSPAESVVGVTRAAALALDRRDKTGTLRPGAPADLVVLDAPSYVDLAYRFGEQPVDRVLKHGSVVAQPTTGVTRSTETQQEMITNRTEEHSE